MRVASTATMPHMLAATIASVWICDNKGSSRLSVLGGGVACCAPSMHNRG